MQVTACFFFVKKKKKKIDFKLCGVVANATVHDSSRSDFRNESIALANVYHVWSDKKKNTLLYLVSILTCSYINGVYVPSIQ